MQRESGEGPEDVHTVPEMHGMPGIPDLIPPANSFQPSSIRYDPGHVPVIGNGLNRNSFSFESPQVRLGQRAPKLGQIGRSKKVVIEDEDLDDILNNNGRFPIVLSLSPVA